MSRESSRFPTGKISFDQEKCIWRCRAVLAREMDSNEMMKELSKRKVLGEKDLWKVRAKPTNTEKNNAILDIIMNRTSDGFLEFVKALDTTGSKTAYKTVLNSLAAESRNTLKKMVEGGKASDFTTGAVFHESESDKSPTHQEEEEEEPKPVKRRPTIQAPPPAKKINVDRRVSVNDQQAKTILELKRDLETAKHETIGLREENLRVVETDKQKDRQIKRLNEMVEAGREKIAKLLAENRHLKSQLESLRRDYENAKKEIASLKDKLEKLEPKTSRNESQATREGLTEDKISKEVAKHFDKMKSEILDEIGHGRRPNDPDLVPILDHQNRRILSFQVPPADNNLNLVLPQPSQDPYGFGKLGGINGLQTTTGRRLTLRDQLGSDFLKRGSVVNGTLGQGTRSDLGFTSLDLNLPTDLNKTNLGVSTRPHFGSVDDGLQQRRNTIWNDAVQNGMLNKQRNSVFGKPGLLRNTGLKKSSLRQKDRENSGVEDLRLRENSDLLTNETLNGKHSNRHNAQDEKRKKTSLKPAENGNDVWDGAVVTKTLQQQPSWAYRDGDIPLWFHHVDRADKARNVRNEALIWERSPRRDEAFTLRWSVDERGRKLLEGFLTERRSKKDPPGRLPRRHKALTLREV